MARLNRDETTILAMFSYMRPRGSVTEQAFINRFLTPLGFKRDQYKNLVLKVGESPLLFSSHVDTVHSVEGTQTLHYADGILQLSASAKRGKSSCLGADDTAGIWLMTEMVKAGIAGTYVIHHGEESGCIGSTDLANGNPDWLQQFSAAIAFDRAHKTDVITHQMGRRTCSDAFAKSLAAQLGCVGPCPYRPDDGGAYTDTNEYTHLIPECTNISVGYKGQHSKNETQDVPFLIALRNQLKRVDWSALVIERDPSVVEDNGPWWSRRDWDDHQDLTFTPRKNRGFSWGRGSGSALDDLCRDYPEVVATILEAYGITRADLMDEISAVYGSVA